MRAPGGCLLLQSCHPWPPGTPLHPPAAVCDEVPECLRDRIVSFEGTSLIDTVSSANKGAGERAALPLSLCCSLCLGRSLDPQPPLRPSLAPGGYCDVPPPVCQSDKGCSVVAPSPRYWTNSSSLAFSFGAFASPGARAAACMCHCPQGTRTHARTHTCTHTCTAVLDSRCPAPLFLPAPQPAAGECSIGGRWARRGGGATWCPGQSTLGTTLCSLCRWGGGVRQSCWRPCAGQHTCPRVARRHWTAPRCALPRRACCSAPLAPHTTDRQWPHQTRGVLCQLPPQHA